MSTWSEHLSHVREKNKDKNLKDCMQIASQSWKHASNKDTNYVKNEGKYLKENKYVEKESKKSTKTNNKLECKETIKYIRQLSADLLNVIDQLSERDLNSLKKAEMRISKIHDSFNDSAM